MNKPDDYADAMRGCLEALDVPLMRKLHAHVFPHLSPPATDHDCLITMHHIRTADPGMRVRLRAYSHRWLVDNGYPSSLPDHLRARAERLYPGKAEMVVVGYRVRSPFFKPVQQLVRGAMMDSVRDSQADGIKDNELIKTRLFEAKDKEIKKLVGRMVLPEDK